MLRNWVTQFGFDAGERAGDEKISNADRGKFIDQVGRYFGWNPPPQMNWAVEVAKVEPTEGESPSEGEPQYVIAFMRYVTKDEADKMLGTNYVKTKTDKKMEES